MSAILDKLDKKTVSLIVGTIIVIGTGGGVLGSMSVEAVQIEQLKSENIEIKQTVKENNNRMEDYFDKLSDKIDDNSKVTNDYITDNRIDIQKLLTIACIDNPHICN